MKISNCILSGAADLLETKGITKKTYLFLLDFFDLSFREKKGVIFGVDRYRFDNTDFIFCSDNA